MYGHGFKPAISGILLSRNVRASLRDKSKFGRFKKKKKKCNGPFSSYLVPLFRAKPLMRK